MKIGSFSRLFTVQPAERTSRAEPSTSIQSPSQASGASRIDDDAVAIAPTLRITAEQMRNAEADAEGGKLTATERTERFNRIKSQVTSNQYRQPSTGELAQKLDQELFIS